MRLNSGIGIGWGVKCYNFVTILLLFYSFYPIIFTLLHIEKVDWVLRHFVAGATG